MRSLRLPTLLIAGAFAATLPISAAEEQAVPPPPNAPFADKPDSPTPVKAPTSEEKKGAEANAPQQPAAEPGRIPALPPEKQNAFAFSLIRHLARDPKASLDNAVLCPGGITRLLQALQAGTKGTAAAEIAKALGLDPNAAAEEQDKNPSPAPDFSAALKTASAIWCDAGTPFTQKFEQAMGEKFGAKTQNLPFHKDPEAARKTINAWISDQTGGNIPELLKAKDLTGAPLVLTDTAWFKDTWKDSFKPEKSVQKDFTLPDGAKRNVTFVSDLRTARIGATPDAQILALPFSTPQFESLCILPILKEKETGGTALARLEQSLKAETLTALLDSLKEQKRITILLPKLDLKGLSLDVHPMLAALGIKAIFRHADFSPMAKNASGLFVSVFKQDTAFRLDEQGAEASAATPVVMSKSALSLENQFRADRPCIFLVRNTETGEVVFYVRCVAPAEAKPEAPASCSQ